MSLRTLCRIFGLAAWATVATAVWIAFARANYMAVIYPIYARYGYSAEDGVLGSYLGTLYFCRIIGKCLDGLWLALVFHALASCFVYRRVSGLARLFFSIGAIGLIPALLPSRTVAPEIVSPAFTFGGAIVGALFVSWATADLMAPRSSWPLKSLLRGVLLATFVTAIWAIGSQVNDINLDYHSRFSSGGSRVPEGPLGDPVRFHGVIRLLALVLLGAAATPPNRPGKADERTPDRLDRRGLDPICS